jgi:hypothetical protein
VIWLCVWCERSGGSVPPVTTLLLRTERPCIDGRADRSELSARLSSAEVVRPQAMNRQEGDRFLRFPLAGPDERPLGRRR